MAAGGSVPLLQGILKQLEQLNSNILAQQTRWERLEEVVRNFNATQSGSSSQDTHLDMLPSTIPLSLKDDSKTSTGSMAHVGDNTSAESFTSIAQNATEMVEAPNDIEARRISHETAAYNPHDPQETLPNISVEISGKGKRVSGSQSEKTHITLLPDNRSWRSSLESSSLHKYDFLKKELGDAWMIPDDGRVPLSFTREFLEELDSNQLRTVVSDLSIFRDRITHSNDQQFYVIDYDGAGGNIVYRLGERAMFGKQPLQAMPKTKITSDAPWSRLIFCQGLNTAQESDRGHRRHMLSTHCLERAPFLLENDRFKTNRYLAAAIHDHSDCRKGQNTMHNEYKVFNWTAFHTTFYEAPSVFRPLRSKTLPRGSWLHGPLFGSDVLDFCESAVTIACIPSESLRSFGLLVEHSSQKNNQFKPRNYLCRHWTILFLGPLDFFGSNFHKFPLGPEDFQGGVGLRSMEGAVLWLLEETYGRLYHSWKDFKTHFGGLLYEEDALFKPGEHDKLLRDDGSFSRSRKYAWVISCLTQFERSIKDNIVQWDKYKYARFGHMLDAGALSPQSVRRIAEIDRICDQLRGLQDYFSSKLDSTKALRDGLFSASTVIESRASTHLGENIRLLTFVSIFFLPLAFCTSLWSINDKFSSSSLIFTSVIVGLVTYIVVFHLESLTYQASATFTPVRNRMIHQMKNDGEDHWATKGHQFVTFRPKLEREKPSEWWIILFWIRQIGLSTYRLLFRRAWAHTIPTTTPHVIFLDNLAELVTEPVESTTPFSSPSSPPCHQNAINTTTSRDENLPTSNLGGSAPRAPSTTFDALLSISKATAMLVWRRGMGKDGHSHDHDQNHINSGERQHRGEV